MHKAYRHKYVYINRFIGLKTYICQLSLIYIEKFNNPESLALKPIKSQLLDKFEHRQRIIAINYQ